MIRHGNCGCEVNLMRTDRNSVVGRSGYLVCVRKSIPLICVCLVILSCSNPLQEVKTEPGRRDYVWFVDTLAAGGNFLEDIDGSNEDDVWAVGNGADARLQYYHFDGFQWHSDGVFKLSLPNAVKAFSSSDVWTAGDEGHIWHFDGDRWSESAKVSADSTAMYFLQDINGTSATNLYAVGLFTMQGMDLHPLIYEYKGARWKRLSIPDIPYTNLIKIGPYSTKVCFVVGFKTAPDGTWPDSSILFNFDGLTLSRLYVGRDNPNGAADFARVEEGMVVRRGRSIDYFDGARFWHLTDIGSSYYGRVVEARNTKDVFLGMRDGVLHWNGTDTDYIYRFGGQPPIIYNMKVFPKSVFILARNGSLHINFVLRGYLKD